MDEKWFGLPVLFLEVLTILQCLETVFGRRLRMDRYLVLLLSVVAAIYGAVNVFRLPPFFMMLSYAGILCYAFVTFRLSRRQTLLRTIIGMALAGCLEAVSALVMQVCLGEGGGSLLLVMASVAALAMAGIIRNIELGKSIDKRIDSGIGKREDQRSVQRTDPRNRSQKLEQAAVILYGSIFLLVLADYHICRRPIRMYVVLAFLLLILPRIYVQGKERTEQALEKIQGELEQHQKYGECYETALKEIRWKQHDYRNQLGAIYSMHLVAGTLEQLVGMQSEYIQDLQKQQKYDGILTSCRHRVLAAYLYQSCCRCEANGVSVTYHLQLRQEAYDMDFLQLTEVLGILMDNACEYVSVEEQVSSCIALSGEDWNGGVRFTVSNPVCLLGQEEILRMFAYGVSTKGEGRGIGLARIGQLAKEQKIFLKVHQRTEESGSWLEISVEFPGKQKGYHDGSQGKLPDIQGR